MQKLSAVALACTLAVSTFSTLATDRVDLRYTANGPVERSGATFNIAGNHDGSVVVYQNASPSATVIVTDFRGSEPFGIGAAVGVGGNLLAIESEGPTAISSNAQYVAFDNITGAFSPISGRLKSAEEDNRGRVFVRDLDNGDFIQIEDSFVVGKQAFSRNGGTLVYSSNGKTRLNIFDLATKTTIHSFYAPSNFFSLSKDGGTVVFRTDANLVPEDTGNHSDVYAYDISSQSYELINVNNFGVKGTDSAHGNRVLTASVSHSAVSANGRFVAFESFTNLTDETSSGTRQVYLRDRVLGETKLVSKSTESFPGNCSESHRKLFCNKSPVISDDGRFVAFVSYSTQLSADPNGTVADAFVRDVKLGVTQIVSIQDINFTVGNKDVSEVAISEDGRNMLFISEANNLQPEITVNDQPTDTNNKADAFQSEHFIIESANSVDL